MSEARSNGFLRRHARKQAHCILSRLRSIVSDAGWLHSLAASSYPSLPIFYNLRSGIWYSVGGAVAHPPTCYFKSTDGHYHTVFFSHARLNLPLAVAACGAGGALVVDVTASVKQFPDSSITLAIWVAVLNAVMEFNFAPGVPPAPPLEAYFPPWQPASVRQACCAKAQEAVESLPAALRAAIAAALAPHMTRPLLPAYVVQPPTGGKEGSWESLPPLLDSLQAGGGVVPIVFVSASRTVGPLGDAQSAQEGWKYIQGAGDDAEGWAGPLGLTPELLRSHASHILEAPTAQACAQRILALAQDTAPVSAPGCGASAPSPLGMVISSAGLNALARAACPVGTEEGSRVLVAHAAAWQTVVQGQAEEGRGVDGGGGDEGEAASCKKPHPVRAVILVLEQRRLEPTRGWRGGSAEAPAGVGGGGGGGGGGAAAAVATAGEEDAEETSLNGEEEEEGGVEEVGELMPSVAGEEGSVAGGGGALHMVGQLESGGLLEHAFTDSRVPVLTLTLPSDKRGHSKLKDAWVSTILPAVQEATLLAAAATSDSVACDGQGAVLVTFPRVAQAPVAAAVAAASLLVLQRRCRGGPMALDKAAVRTAVALAAMRCAAPSVDRRYAQQLNRYFFLQ